MATIGDPSEASLALAVRLGIAKEGEPMTPLMSMLTTMKDYADNVDIGALAGTQASWATCIPHAEKLLELERKALEELRAKAVEWDSKLSSRTGELAELDARFETITQETARAGEQLLDATRKQSEATKQLARTLETTRVAQESHATEEERLKVKEELLSTYNDQLEKREASSASKEADLKRWREEVRARESRIAATERHARESERNARESDSQAEEHLKAIRNAHLALSMLAERTGLPTTKLSAHELLDSFQSLTSDVQDQLGHLKDQITHLYRSHKTDKEQQAKAHLIGARVLKGLREDVAAQASQIKKAELGAADYRRKYESLQGTSSQRIHELELSNNNISITNNSFEGRLSEALQNHKEMVAEARRLAEHCENLKSQGVANAENAATDIDRLQTAHRDEVSRMRQVSDTIILELDEIVKRQEQQLKDAEKLATEQEDRLRKAEDLSTSLYKTIKDGAPAIDSANKCRMEHHDFDVLKRRSSELRAEVERSSRARIDDREADIRIIQALKSQEAASHNEIRRLRRMNLENRENDIQAVKTLEGRIAQLELVKLDDRRIDIQTIEALRSELSESQTKIECLNRTISIFEERRAQISRDFGLVEIDMKALESANAEAMDRATTAENKLRTYEKTITRLRSERDDAREELGSANATHSTALEDARHELESLQERATPDNQNGQSVNKRARTKRTAAEMLEEDVPGHAFDLRQIRDPDFEDPNIPGDILVKLHQQFDQWNQKSGQEWARQPTKSRCVEARCAKISSKHLHGNEYACNHCEERGRVCVVIRRAGTVNLLPVYQDGEAVRPNDEGYWTK